MPPAPVADRQEVASKQEMGGDLYDLKKAEPAAAAAAAAAAADPLYDDEEDQFVAIPPLHQPHTVVKPENLKLLHRIGRGPFGDMWLANIHSHRDDFDEYHEVAVKVLPSLSQEQLQKLEEIISVSSQGPDTVSWPRGISMKNGKACVITKLYEMSVGDKMARLPGNSIPLADALRYGISLAEGVTGLHSRGLMALNLKPFNFLLDEHDQAVVGEFGLPFLLMGSVAADGPLVWLGTPNYMSPEQWEPKLRGPVSFESDAWGFSCGFIEMVTGVKPWSNLSPSDIFSAVVDRGEKPAVPSGLPSALQRMLKSCLAYDRRDRPSFSEILAVLRSPSVLFKESDWIMVTDKSFKQGARVGVVKKVKGPESLQVVFCDKPEEPVDYTGLAKCSLWKDELQTGDVVRLKQCVTGARFGWTEQADAEGTVTEVDKDNAVMLVRFPESGETFKADPSEIQLSAHICAGDWVRVRDGWSAEGDGARSPSSTGIVHRVMRNSGGVVQAAFLGRETLWEGPASHLVKVPALHVGQFVKVKKEVIEPRFEWLVKRGRDQMVWETGRISCILSNGSLVMDFPGRLFQRKRCWADADEVEIVRLNDCPSLGEKYSHLQAMHWAIGPAICLLGFLAAAKAGTVVGGIVIRPFGGGGGKRKSGGDQPSSEAIAAPATGNAAELRVDPAGSKGGNNNNTMWLPHAVTSMLFKEGQTSS